jgi:hypothetical protein
VTIVGSNKSVYAQPFAYSICTKQKMAQTWQELKQRYKKYSFKKIKAGINFGTNGNSKTINTEKK